MTAAEQQATAALAAIRSQQSQGRDTGGTAIYGNGTVNVFQVQNMTIDSRMLEMLLRGQRDD